MNNQQRIGLKHYEDFIAKIPRIEVEEISAIVKETVASVYPEAICMVCGSYRRGKLESGDVDLIITPSSQHSADTLPSTALAEIIRTLTDKGFLTDHLALPRSSGNTVSDIHGNDYSDDNDDEGAISSGKSSYMGVCKLPGEGRRFRRIDIKVSSLLNKLALKRLFG